MNYDYLIVGAGLYGATFARLATDAGRKVLVIDKRDHLAGNCFDSRVDGILVNRFGGHIFHTNSKLIWDFVNRFASFSNYQHKVIADCYGNKISLPINLWTLHQLLGVDGPADAWEMLGDVAERIPNPQNFEEQVLSTLGAKIYHLLFYGYTKKQWGREPRELPASIAKRIPIRLTYDDRYFDDTYQGMPTEGYTEMVRRMLEGIPVELGWGVGHDWMWTFKFNHGAKVVYSGPLDELFDYRFGKLEYRSLRFEHETKQGDYQGCATMNYTDEETPYTRIIEWKHFRPEERHANTVITREYPEALGEPYYPVGDEANRGLHKKYADLVPSWMVVGGRLGSYQYLNMDQACAMAMKDVRRELG
jgi:UDP-galactopyranose mutase